MTKARKAVLAALEAVRRPLSAAELLERVGCACDQATVYRALSFLEERGSVQSFALRCAEHRSERYYLADLAHHHWLHCEDCHRFIDLGDCRLGELCARVEEEYGVEVTGHSLSFSGYCPECAQRRRAAGREAS
jgi:Fur family ferric uptake transcriptional regulator